MSIFDFYHFLSFVSLCTITCFAHISLNSCPFDFFLLPTCRSRFHTLFYCTRMLASFHAHTQCAHLCSISVSTVQYAVDRMLVVCIDSSFFCTQHRHQVCYKLIACNLLCLSALHIGNDALHEISLHVKTSMSGIVLVQGC